MNGYKTVSGEFSAEIEVKKSRFIATVAPCKTETEATAFLASMRKKYWDARHNVYAFSLRENGTKRFSDDGEPHSTAGLPVMETIEHAGVTDIVMVVTRYFGGILLGTGGLVRAYSEAARAVLEAAEIVSVLPAKKITIKCDYADYEPLLKLIEPFGVKILVTDYSETVNLIFAVPSNYIDDLSEKITDAFCGKMHFLAVEDIFLGF